MPMYRVRVILSGGAVNGGGVATHWFNSGGGTAQQAATAVGTFWGTLDNECSSGTTWTLDQDVHTIDETNGETTGITSVTAATGTGAAATEGLPLQIMALIRWRTFAFIGGREVRGRTFVPGQLESNNAATAQPSAGLKATYDGAAAALIADANSILVVYSPTHQTFLPVASSSTWSKWADLSSRRD